MLRLFWQANLRKPRQCQMGLAKRPLETQHFEMGLARRPLDIQLLQMSLARRPLDIQHLEWASWECGILSQTMCTLATNLASSSGAITQTLAHVGHNVRSTPLAGPVSVC